MNARGFFLTMLLLSPGIGWAAQAEATSDAARPNIIVIMTDDQELDSMAFMTNPGGVTRMRNGGTTFDNGFVTYSLCCPSRATFLTGQYSHNHGVESNWAPAGGYAKLDHSNTLAVWLQDAGYHTVLLGKYLNGYGKTDTPIPGDAQHEIPPGWSEWYGGTDIYTMYGYTLNENGKLDTYGTGPDDYQTDVLARKAADFIAGRATAARLGTDRRPFFLWLTPMAIHAESPTEDEDPPLEQRIDNPRAAPRHEGLFYDLALPMPPDFNEVDVSDKPQVVQRLPLMDAEEIDRLTWRYRSRMEALLAVDDLVEKILTTLDQTGLIQNTLVVFTSDNGYLYGSHRVPGGKVFVYEDSIRVPLVMYGAGIPAGTRSTKIALNIDLAPTIVESAQAEATVGRTMDGRSLWAILRDPGASWRSDFLVEGAVMGFNAVRTGRFVYSEFTNGDREFYDLSSDPYQLTSKHTSASAADRATMAYLERRLDALMVCQGTEC